MKKIKKINGKNRPCLLKKLPDIKGLKNKGNHSNVNIIYARATIIIKNWESIALQKLIPCFYKYLVKNFPDSTYIQ